MTLLAVNLIKGNIEMKLQFMEIKNLKTYSKKRNISYIYFLLVYVSYWFVFKIYFLHI